MNVAMLKRRSATLASLEGPESDFACLNMGDRLVQCAQICTTRMGGRMAAAD